MVQIFSLHKPIKQQLLEKKLLIKRLLDLTQTQ